VHCDCTELEQMTRIPLKMKCHGENWSKYVPLNVHQLFYPIC
jgi:hypothetical protein